MKAMILAAGMGERLQPFTLHQPKALVPVAGRPMIEYPLRLLKYYGIQEIIVNLHHLGEQIEAYLGDGAKLGVNIRYSREPELLDTGGGLLKAKPFLADGTFIVINTDVLIDLSLEELVAFHKKNRATATLVLRSDELADKYGSMEIDSENRIYRFLQASRKRTPQVFGTKLMFTGVQVLEPKIFDYMKFDGTPERFSTTKDVYPRMVLKEDSVYGFRFDGFWQDLGTTDRIKEAEEALARGIAKLRYV